MFRVPGGCPSRLRPLRARPELDVLDREIALTNDPDAFALGASPVPRITGLPPMPLMVSCFCPHGDAAAILAGRDFDRIAVLCSLRHFVDR